MLNYLMLLVALALSAVAAYYSIAGLVVLFAAAAIPVMVMASTLELAKVVATSWVYRNWHTAPRIIKYYLVIAIFILMAITSMGIFGFLSKAHLDQAIPSGDVAAKIGIYDEKVKISKDNIDANRKALKQLDEAVDQVMGRSTDEKGADKAVAIRRSQNKDRARLLLEIQTEQATISKIMEESAPLRAEARKVAIEVGPIKYVAELFYGSSDAEIVDKAVRWVIVMIVAVFDPMAIILLVAANHSLTNPMVPGAQQQNKLVKAKMPDWLRTATRAKRMKRIHENRRKNTIEIDKASIFKM
jgi:hypothetical protein